jgi:hypothetical protein
MAANLDGQLALAASPLQQQESKKVKNAKDILITEEEDIVTDVPAMFRSIMQAIRSNSADIQTARDEAKSAKQAAITANLTIAKVEEEVVKLRTEMDSFKAEGLKQAVQEIVGDMTWPTLPGQAAHGGKGFGKGFGKGAGVGKGLGSITGDIDKKCRTVYFRPFPEDTPAGDIVDFINEKIGDASSGLDEGGVYAFGRDFADGGAARFQSPELMWTFLQDNKGALNYKFGAGGSMVYANADVAASGQDVDKNRAMRKLIRTLIEQSGGDGEEIKRTRLSRDFRKGIVRWKGEDGLWERVGVWCEIAKDMELKGHAAQFRDAFRALCPRR